jgi:hypothetical protein
MQEFGKPPPAGAKDRPGGFAVVMSKGGRIAVVREDDGRARVRPGR